MIEIKYQKGPIRIAHIWFHKNSDVIECRKNAEVFFFHGVDAKINNRNIISLINKHTLLSDLSLPAQDLWSKISKSHQNEIRRFERDGGYGRMLLSYDIIKEPALINDFEAMYNRMFTIKGIKNTFNKKLLYKYAENDALLISVAYFNNEPVVFHSYIIDSSRGETRFWYSCSSFRNDNADTKRIGWANRFLHWFDFNEQKTLGVKKYDWGGVNFDNPEIRGISEFKKSFGGTECEYYDVISARNRGIKLLTKFIIGHKED